MKKFLIGFFVICAVFLRAEEAKPKTICLNMIVRDESGVIKRCLSSVKGIIDYWVIVDTGSKDITEKVVRKFMKDIPGEYHNLPWVDFAHNRNEALDLAKGKADYVLFIDADEQLVIPPSFNKASLDKDLYVVTVFEKSSTKQRVLLVNNHKEWTWEGVIYELIRSFETPTNASLPNVTILANTEDGYRSKDPDKYLKDIKILEKVLEKEPDNVRYAAILAENYEKIGDYEQALKAYQRRSLMGGWDAEVYQALYKMGECEQRLDKPMEEIVFTYSKAYHQNPYRAEPLFRLATYFSSKGFPALSYALTQFALEIPFQNNVPFGEKWIYDYGMTLEKAVSAGNLGRLEEALVEFKKILNITNVPREMHETTKENIANLEKIIAQMEEKEKE